MGENGPKITSLFGKENVKFWPLLRQYIKAGVKKANKLIDPFNSHTPLCLILRVGHFAIFWEKITPHITL